MGVDFCKPRTGAFWLVFPLGLLCIAPFLSLWRVGPLSSFYLEAGALLFVLLLVFSTGLAGRLKQTAVPRGSVYFLLLAAYWWIQARVMNLPYVGQSDQAVWSFAVLALGIWAVRAWQRGIGQRETTDVFAAVLLIGALLQALVCWMQFAGWAAEFPGILAYRGQNNITGQLGQRNHLGHYLMWGVLSAAYLWAQRRIVWWGGAAAVLFLTGTLGLVGSRTILLYIAASGLLVLLWRLRSGRAGNRAFFIITFALLSVVAVQIGLNGILAWFGGTQVETALQRVGGSSFSGSARDLEWANAWRIFQTAPLWGQGWGSFSLQGFLNSRFADGFSPHGISVLFTHSHNIVLQLLAEMGLAGTLLVFGGAAWVIRPFFRQSFGLPSLLALSLMSVSLCHSLLEYPLWYVYFLAPLALLTGLAPSTEAEAAGGSGGVTSVKPSAACLILILAAVFAAGIVRLAWVYYGLVEADHRPQNESAEQAAQKTDCLRQISHNEPLLAYYADLALTRRAAPSDTFIRDWAVEAAGKALVYRPYATSYQWGLYQYRLGRKEEGREWMRRLYRYYPNMLPFYLKQMKNSPYFAELYPEAKQYCREFARLRPQAKACEP
ncbi:MAG: Wzy polymerase domain-containing protein [Neisseria sp.]|nr:Wzy polymerase domain-containing protein [Neisseria sp.]